MIIKNKQKSFTLIELLVVIVIIGILAGVIMISTSSSIDKANFAKAQAFSSTVQNELLSNLVSEWTFDEGINQAFNRVATNDDVKDTWGSNNGTVYGNPQIKGGDDCIFGKCMSFDGDGDYINYGNKSSLQFRTGGISMWFNNFKESYDGSAIVLARAPNTNWNAQNWLIYLNGFELNFAVGDGSTYNWQRIPIINPKINNWYNIFVNLKCEDIDNDGLEDTEARIYLNGIYQKSLIRKDFCVGTNNRPVKIGGDGNRYFNGVIDDIRLYNAALSSSQIKQNYIAGLNSMLSNGNISKQEYNERINNLAYNDNNE